MKTNILAAADALSGPDLLAHLDALAGRERSASAELVAHLAALESRPELYAAKGYGSLFSYCTQALRLSEDAACNRIEAAKACRRFPVILDLLASGALTLTSVRILSPHLRPENHAAVLERAKGLASRQIEGLIAELAPRPDVPTSIRKLPTLTAAPPAAAAAPIGAATSVASEPAVETEHSRSVFHPPARPIIEATAPGRYRAQFTMDEDMHARLRRLQADLRREIPDGDPAAIFGRALRLLEADVAKTKLGASVKPRPRRSIRRGTDSKAVCKSGFPSRYVPKEVRRAVWQRDEGQCAFVSADHRRCTERTFLEFHHVQAYAKRGLPTVDNISLRCRRHNQYEAELVFGRQSCRMGQPREVSARCAGRVDQPPSSRVPLEPRISPPVQRPDVLWSLIRTPPPRL
jgi:5-methylcytosine-specific restriction endonuclease McrA